MVQKEEGKEEAKGAACFQSVVFLISVHSSSSTELDRKAWATRKYAIPPLTEDNESLDSPFGKLLNKRHLRS